MDFCCFDENSLPELVYICPIRLDGEGQEMHSHMGQAELMLVQEGTGIAIVDGQREEVVQGDFILCGAGIPHRYHAKEEKAFAGVSCGFTRLMCRGMDENQFISPDDHPIIHAGTGSRALAELLSVLSRTVNDPSVHSAELCRYLSAAVVTAALQIQHVIAESAGQTHYNLGIRARMYLDRHYLEPLTLDQISRAVGVSKYHLDRVFLASTGCTPIQYVTRRRMARAQALLGSTSQTVQHIAAQCGYSNYNYFTVLFRRTVGMTPGQYRKLTQGYTGRHE